MEWLNQSNGTDSHKRVVWIKEELDNLRAQFIMHGDAYHHISGGIFRMGEALGGHEKDWPKEKLRVQRRLQDRHVALNLQLSKYVFRPRATYVIAGRSWIFGMVPDENKKWFKVDSGDEVLSEADAVLCLVRLAESGDLARVRRCEMCKDKWLFAAKRNHRFCSDDCRESFYAVSPDYHGRKATNQQKYRERLKRINAAQGLGWKGEQ